MGSWLTASWQTVLARLDTHMHHCELYTLSTYYSHLQPEKFNTEVTNVVLEYQYAAIWAAAAWILFEGLLRIASASKVL